MTKILLTAALILAAVLLVWEALQLRGAEAATQLAADPAAAGAPPAYALPSTHEPFDTTPITPVESAGAPMMDAP